jgi:hypothetical protein
MRRFSHLFTLTLTIFILTCVTSQTLSATAKSEARRVIAPFDFSRINKQMIEEFDEAWRIAKCGTSDYEGVVLLYLLPDGNYKVQALKSTNEYKKFTFTWSNDIVAIFHTHPRSVDPRPSAGDMELADARRVLMFTMTIRGMYVYDPATTKTNLILSGIDWLDESKWTDAVALKMASLSPSFSSQLLAKDSW